MNDNKKPETFDDEAFLVREDNLMTFKMNVNHYQEVMNNVMSNPYNRVKTITEFLLEQGEPQKAAVVKRYEEEKAAFEKTDAAASNSSAAA